MFKTIRKHIVCREEAFRLIRDLSEYADAYAALRTPLDDMWDAEESRALRQLQMFNVRQPLALLLACFARFGEENRAAFTKVLRAISIVSFRYNVICNMQTNEQERVYNDIAVRVSHGDLKSGEDVTRALEPIYPADYSRK